MGEDKTLGERIGHALRKKPLDVHVTTVQREVIYAIQDGGKLFNRPHENDAELIFLEGMRWWPARSTIKALIEKDLIILIGEQYVLTERGERLRRTSKTARTMNRAQVYVAKAVYSGDGLEAFGTDGNTLWSLVSPEATHYPQAFSDRQLETMFERGFLESDGNRAWLTALALEQIGETK